MAVVTDQILAQVRKHKAAGMADEDVVALMSKLHDPGAVATCLGFSEFKAKPAPAPKQAELPAAPAAPVHKYSRR